MFLRFSKGSYRHDKGYIHTIRKCVFLGDSLVMEYGSKIVGIAKLHEETNKCFDYDVVVAAKCELGAETIARYIKGMIGKANKWCNHKHQFIAKTIENALKRYQRICGKLEDDVLDSISVSL